MARVAFFNYSKLVNLDEEERDLVDLEIKRVSQGFGDEEGERK